VHTWRPDAKTWAEIKKHSVKAPATVTIAGFRSENAAEPVSSGQVNLQTSKDPRQLRRGPLKKRVAEKLTNAMRNRGRAAL